MLKRTVQERANVVFTESVIEHSKNIIYKFLSLPAVSKPIRMRRCIQFRVYVSADIANDFVTFGSLLKNILESVSHWAPPKANQTFEIC